MLFLCLIFLVESCCELFFVFSLILFAIFESFSQRGNQLSHSFFLIRLFFNLINRISFGNSWQLSFFYFIFDFTNQFVINDIELNYTTFLLLLLQFLLRVIYILEFLYLVPHIKVIFFRCGNWKTNTMSRSASFEDIYPFDVIFPLTRIHELIE